MRKGFNVRGLIFRCQRTMDLLRGLHAYDPVRKRTRLRGPFAVQIQTINRCNASCSMCPYATTQKADTPRRMDEDLYIEILET